jgi:hypothetical protein
LLLCSTNCFFSPLFKLWAFVYSHFSSLLLTLSSLFDSTITSTLTLIFQVNAELLGIENAIIEGRRLERERIRYGVGEGGRGEGREGGRE